VVWLSAWSFYFVFYRATFSFDSVPYLPWHISKAQQQQQQQQQQQHQQRPVVFV